MLIRWKWMMCSAAAVAMAWLIGAGLTAKGTDRPRRPGDALFGRIVQTAGTTSDQRLGTNDQRLIKAVWSLQAGQPAAAKKPVTAGEFFKNVQVLKDLTVDDFMGTMGIMTASLAFCCRDCHPGAGSDTVVWENDTPRKRTARRMVSMVQDLNKQNFNGRQVVTCWTCHRARDFPVTTMEMDTVYGESNVQLDDVLRPVQGMPPVDQIIDKYIQAIGGAERVGAVRSFVAKGTGEEFSGQGGKARVEINAVAPDKRATYLSFPEDPSRGDSTRTFDGRIGWMATPLAAVRKYELNGSEVDGARLDAQLSFPAQIKQVLTGLRVGPDVSVSGHLAYVVQGNGQNGSMASLYFDRQSSLLIRIVRYVNTPIGRVPTQFDFDDYRDVNGVKMPFSITFSWLDGKQLIKLTDIQLNAQIDPAKFGEPNPLASVTR